jgi:DNA-binding CsgD family transcriptional regulator
LLDQDWELMTDTCAHLALGWPAGEVGRHAAQRLRESVTPEAARAALEAMGRFDVTDLLPRLRVPTLVLHRNGIPWLPVDIDAFLGEGEEGWMARLGAWAPDAEQEGPRQARAYPDGLTAREAEVLGRLAGGKTNNEIAEELHVSVRTVERHIANIYAKIGARGRANATAYALTHNLI